MSTKIKQMKAKMYAIALGAVVVVIYVAVIIRAL